MQRPAFSIYDASAGSGKTYTLVMEYLKIILLAKPDDAYRNILAITFTNKAVHEMKSRIVDSLSEFAKETPSENALGLMQHISGETGITEAQISAKAQAIIRHIIHNYAAFDISTIDKFTHRVIRTFANDLKLPVTFDVSLDTEILLTEAVDALIARAGDDDTLTKLLVDFTMEKADDDKSWDISREIMDTGRMALNENNRNEITHFKDKSIEQFIDVKKRLQQECSALEIQSVTLAKEALALIEQNGIEFKSFYSGYVPNHFTKLSAGEIIRHIGHYKYLEEIECKRCSAKTPQEQKDLVDKIADVLLDKLKKINEIAEKYMFYTAFLRNITPLSLLNTVNTELTRIQKEQNILSITEFNRLINDEIRNQPAPFIYERMGERYRHFFIDEFQDTSEMQWENLIPLIDNATSSEDLSKQRGSVMIVGDPKQSIYRWRGGKAEQFISLAKDNNPFNNPDKKIFTLDKNWRSHEEVISFNNDFFAFLSEEFENADYKDLYANHSRQKTNSKQGGHVSISFIPAVADCDDDDNPDKTLLYVRKTLKTIVGAVANGFALSDIAILTRKREHGIAVANYLTEQGVKIISSETLMIGNATEVRFVINVLKYLKNAADAEAKASFLYYIATNIQHLLPVHDFIAAGMAYSSEAEFEAWLKESGIELMFEAVRQKSLYEAVETIIIKCLQHQPHNGYVQFFLDIVLERDVKSQAGISDFLDFWDKNSAKFSIPSPEDSDAVRILTIHKSKGLEFPVVIFPFAEENYSRKPKDKLWLDSDEEVFGLPRVLIDNSSSVENFGEGASAVYLQKKQEELLDNINVLYVAVTRAKQQLYIISAMNLSKKDEAPKNSCSGFLIKYLDKLGIFEKTRMEYTFGDAASIQQIKKQKKEQKHIIPVAEILDPKSIKIARKESMMWGTVQQEAIEYGNTVHEILSRIDTVEDIELAMDIALENGEININQFETVKQTITGILSNQELKEFYSSEHKTLNEQMIIRKSGRAVKPDRMVVTASGEVYLLDYKTGAHSQKYIAQLSEYQEAIEKMGFRVTKKSLVYIGEKVNVVNL